MLNLQYIYTHVYVYTYIHTYVCVCVCVCACVCVYIVCVYIYEYIMLSKVSALVYLLLKATILNCKNVCQGDGINYDVVRKIQVCFCVRERERVIVSCACLCVWESDQGFFRITSDAGAVLCIMNVGIVLWMFVQFIVCALVCVNVFVCVSLCVNLGSDVLLCLAGSLICIYIIYNI